MAHLYQIRSKLTHSNALAVGFCLALCGSVTTTLLSSAQAQENSYTNDANGKWEDGANWSLGVAPTNAQSIFVTNAASKTVMIDATTSGSSPDTMTINSLTLSAEIGSTNTLSLNDPGTNTPLVILTTMSVVTGGVLTVTNAVLSGATGIFDGDVRLDDVSATISSVSVGNLSKGTLTINNGSFVCSGISVGVNDGSEGTFKLSGGAVQLSGLSFEVGFNAGSTGTVLVTGGELTDFNEFLVLGDQGFGQMTVSGGTVAEEFVIVGASPGSRGSLTVTGDGSFETWRIDIVLGTLLVTGGEFTSIQFPGSGIYIGEGSGSAGSMTLSGGTVTVNRIVVGTNGTFMFNSGVLSARDIESTNNQPFVVGDGVGSATLNLPGGCLPFCPNVYSFQDGLIVSSNALLTGCGATNNGVVVNHGTILTDCPGAPLVFNSPVTNDSLMVASNGGALQFFQTVVNNGVIDATNGVVQFFAGVVDNGTILYGTGTNCDACVSNFPSANSYTNPANGKWEVGSNWSQGVPPNSSFSVFITNDFTKVVTIDSITAGDFPGTMTITNLTLSAPTGSVDALLLDDVGTSVPLRILSRLEIDNGGALTITNGSLRIDGPGLGNNAVDGDLTLDSGSITINSLAIGNLSKGTLTINNGSFVCSGISVGVNDGSEGTFKLSGGAVQLSGLSFEVGFNAGSTGTVLVTGGELTDFNEFLVLGDQGFGQMTVSGGTVAEEFVLVGDNPGSRGSLTVTGDGTFDAWRIDIVSGTLVMAGGELTSIQFPGSGIYIGEATGNAASMTVSNGTVVVNKLVVGTNSASRGELNIVGGTVTVLSGANDSLVEGLDTGSTGSVTVAGGQLTVTNGTAVIGSMGVGHMMVSNGTVLASTILLGSSAGGAGDLTISSNGVVDFGFSSAGTNTALVANDLILDGGLLMITNGTLYCGKDHPGSMIMSNGTAFCHTMYVGYDYPGEMTMDNGTMSIGSQLVVGFLAGSTGQVSLAGGQLLLTNVNHNIIGLGGVGQLSVSNARVLASELQVGGTGVSLLGPVGGPGGTLSLSGGTVTLNAGLDVGTVFEATGMVWVTGGQLLVTNGAITVGGNPGSGQFVISNGWVQARSLVLTNGANSQFRLSGGTLSSGGTVVTNGQPFVVGDGSSAAMFNLLGGVHWFANTLEMANNSTLSGCGTINGTVVVDAGGTVLANCGTLSFGGAGIVSNSGTIIAAPGAILDFNGPVVNSGLIDASQGIIHFNSTTNGPGTILTPLAPTVCILRPHDGMLYPLTNLITIVASATANDGGAISKIEFFAGDAKLGETNANPGTYLWRTPPVGGHMLTAVATDTLGASNISATVTITNGVKNSPLGDWEVTISGADKGAQFLTFADDFTASGYGIRLKTFGLDDVSGHWGFNAKGLVTGTFFEVTDSTTNWSGTVSETVKSLKTLSGAVPATNAVVGSLGTFHWSGIPATTNADLSGTWTGVVLVARTMPVAVSYVFSANTNASAVFDITTNPPPDTAVGQLLVTSRNKVYGYITVGGTNITMSGKFNETKLSMTLQSTAATAQKLSVKLFQQ